MSKILWIGSYVTESEMISLNKLGYKNGSSYLSQKNILEGLEYHTGTPVDSIGAVVMPEYPHSKVLWFDRRTFHHSQDSENVLVGFLNIRYISKLSASLSLVAEAKRWAKRHRNETDPDIFVYEMRSACINAACAVKRIIPSAKIHLIIPDLPLFMDLKMSRVKRLLKQYDYSQMQKKLDMMDTFIPYAQPMVDYLGIRDRKWLLMEGSMNASECSTPPLTVRDQKHDRFVIMYSGYLDGRFGLLNLTEAFKYLDDRYELWITGGGPLENDIRERASQDSRIRFYGFLPSRSELLHLQQKASVMINMRDPDEEASQYCFPSKLFEYLLSGKPVLSCRLGGIPDEYFNHLIEMKSIRPEDIADTIITVEQMSAQDLKKRGESGAAFISEKKNNLTQAKIILDFIHRH